MTVDEYLKINNMKSSQLAEKLGVSCTTVSNAKAGGKMSAEVTKRFQSLGIEVNGTEGIENINNLPTVKEYMDSKEMSYADFARQFCVSYETARNMYRDDYQGARYDLAKRLLSAGIYVPVIDYSKRENTRKKNIEKKNVGKTKVKKKIKIETWLKPFQIEAVKKLGNTIVKLKPKGGKELTFDNVIEEYAKFGLDVRCRSFNNNLLGYGEGFCVVERNDLW